MHAFADAYRVMGAGVLSDQLSIKAVFLDSSN
jgi:hypothetical protein